MTATRRPIRFGLKNRTQRARAIGAHLYIGCGGGMGIGGRATATVDRNRARLVLVSCCEIFAGWRGAAHLVSYF